MTRVREHYPSLEGARAFSAIAILSMHVQANSSFEIAGIGRDAIEQFGELVLLFMMISSFSLCCGYYKRIKNNQLSMDDFYKKRFEKIWPFFALLVGIDVIWQRNVDALFEAFADLTLCFSLLPNPNIEVIGVGWFLGVVFLFYMLFPYFCFLLENKKRAWFVFVISIIYHIVCGEYFFDEKHVIDGYGSGNNFLWYAMYFVAGGLIYLYRKELLEYGKKIKGILLLGAVACTSIYLIEDKMQEGYSNSFWLLFTFALWLIYAISTDSKILVNPIAKFLSSISMEIYLSHMLIFRAVEKLNLLYVFGRGWVAYVFAVLLVLVGAIVFSLFVNRVLFPMFGRLLVLIGIKKNKKI